MLILARLRRHALARRLIIAFTGVWLYAALSPCLMADDAHCPDCPPAADTPVEDVHACPPAMEVDCALPDFSPVALDWSADVHAPIAVLAILPAATTGAPATPLERHAENAALAAPPPLALRPAVLLI